LENEKPDKLTIQDSEVALSMSQKEEDGSEVKNSPEENKNIEISDRPIEFNKDTNLPSISNAPDGLSNQQKYSLNLVINGLPKGPALISLMSKKVQKEMITSIVKLVRKTIKFLIFMAPTITIKLNFTSQMKRSIWIMEELNQMKVKT